MSDKPQMRPPITFAPSMSSLGVTAQHGRLIEIRAPNPDAPTETWPRIWLTSEAARALLAWLPDAIEMQVERKPAEAPS